METEMALPTYLTPRQLADATGLPVESIRVALRRGELPAVRMGQGRGRGYYIRRDAALAWLRDREHVQVQAGIAGVQPHDA